MFPEDFELHSKYGRGFDWPIGYDQLEPHYAMAEELMNIAGPEASPVPRSRPYPLPAHVLSEPEKLLRARHPEHFFPCPTARASRLVEGSRTRASCCTSYVCNFCPVDAKFTIQNGMRDVYADSRVELRTNATVQRVERQGTVATGVTYTDEHGAETTVNAEVIALAANAVFNPHILLRSGFDDAALGRYLHEQVGISAHVLLDGLDAFQGSTSCTGHHHGRSTGELRRERAAFLLETYSKPRIRLSPGKWRQLMLVVGVYEDLPNADNRVEVDSKQPTKPRTVFADHSEYTMAGIAQFGADLESMLEGLPIEDIQVRKARATEGHILGTARMGKDPQSSVVDEGLRHHRVRNLLVLGGSAFPSGSPANPSLTIAALSLWAAERLFA
jgi:choline dehydrogenase-like flavoprotein